MNALMISTPLVVPVTGSSTTRVLAESRPEGEQPPVAPDVVREPLSSSPTEAGSGARQQPGEITPKTGAKLRELVGKANDSIRAQGSELRFHVDDDTGAVVVKVVDEASGKVVRQIPSDEMLSLMKRLEGMVQEPKTQAGLIVSGKA